MVGVLYQWAVSTFESTMVKLTSQSGPYQLKIADVSSFYVIHVLSEICYSNVIRAHDCNLFLKIHDKVMMKYNRKPY